MSRSGDIPREPLAARSAEEAPRPYTEFPEEAMIPVRAALFGKKASQAAGEVDPKTRLVGERYDVVGDKSALGGINTGKKTVKKLKARHEIDTDDIYYRPTLFKSYESYRRADVSVREVLATHLYNLANSNTAGMEATKTFLARDEGDATQVGVRFHKGYQTLKSKREGGEDLSQVDGGAALAQSFWLGDADGHNANTGTLPGSSIIARIDFDRSFLDTPSSSIQWAISQPSLFPTFIDSLSQESFAQELSRLSGMEYHKSPQFQNLLENIYKSYDAHSATPLTPEEKEKIKTRIVENLEKNCIEMKFMAEAAKINVIMKKEGELSAEDRTAILSATRRLEELQGTYPGQAQFAMFNASTIFGAANVDDAKRAQVSSIITEAHEEIGKSFELGVNRAAVIKDLSGAVVDMPKVVARIAPANAEFFTQLCSNAELRKRIPTFERMLKHNVYQEFRDFISRVSAVEEIPAADLQYFSAEVVAKFDFDGVATLVDDFLSPENYNKLLKAAAEQENIDAMYWLLASKRHVIDEPTNVSVRAMLMKQPNGSSVALDDDCLRKFFSAAVDNNDIGLATKIYYFTNKLQIDEGLYERFREGHRDLYGANPAEKIDPSKIFKPGMMTLFSNHWHEGRKNAHLTRALLEYDKAKGKITGIDLETERKFVEGYIQVRGAVPDKLSDAAQGYGAELLAQQQVAAARAVTPEPPIVIPSPSVPTAPIIAAALDTTVDRAAAATSDVSVRGQARTARPRALSTIPEERDSSLTDAEAPSTSLESLASSSSRATATTILPRESLDPALEANVTKIRGELQKFLQETKSSDKKLTTSAAASVETPEKPMPRSAAGKAPKSRRRRGTGLI